MTEQPHSAASVTAAEPPTVFTALADIVYQGSDVSQIYATICRAATLMVPGCDHASILLKRKDHYVTVAATDDVARQVDALEKATGDGPCLDAIEEEAAQVETDLATAQHWPRLAARVVAETPVRAAMGFRLRVADRKVGALNLFSDTRGAFDTTAVDRAIVLVAFASVAVNAAAAGEDVGQLRTALVSNREIGKAIGMLMVLHGLTEDEAFDLLRRTSQRMNVKLADVARTIVQQHHRQ
ncbi:GAF and ANTAR domain-containing protein [Mycolicibacterium fortuitum]|uniref:GAF and ANTAR domain-containing protein n=1 Tax=Mycolicibacterium fortuitum TaxID=1766 RepID=UPI001CDCAA17|nr:GAF and ANTAR domain-containing protein [Mycolicibacterium fortuitum]